MRELDSLLAEALDLPEDQRALLALRLAKSLGPTPAPDAQDAWAKEIARRIERLREGSASTVTTEQALADARARLTSRRA